MVAEEEEEETVEKERLICRKGGREALSDIRREIGEF